MMRVPRCVHAQPGAFAMLYSFVTKTMNILALERAKGNRKMQKRVKKVRVRFVS